MSEYSISQLSKFEECALQYKFIYVDGIKRSEEGVQVIAGTDVRLRVTGKDRVVSPAKGLIREIRARAFVLDVMTL
jgi:hypothetical protein